MSDKQLQFGIIGSGSRGIESFGRQISAREGATVVALCDPNPVRMKHNSEKLKGNQNFYSTVEEMLDKENLSAVVITSPDYCHRDNAVAALSRGVNALIDKPLATTVEGCRDIISAAEKNNSIAMMGFNLRHAATLKRLKKIIDDGILGKVFLIENREFYDGGRTYMARWNRKYEWSGGLWIHKGSHDFDVFNWLLGFPKPKMVSATAGINVLNPDHLPFEAEQGVPAGPTCHECPYAKKCPDVRVFEGDEWGSDARDVDGYAKDTCIYMSDKDVHDNGIAIVEYENGVRCSHLECFVTSLSDRLYTVVGELGQAEVSLHDRKILVRPRWSQEIDTYQIPEETGGHGGADPHLIDVFIKSLRGEITNTSTLEHGLWSTAIGQAAEISARQGRMVQISELFE